jgi:uncharacterized protein (DUF362 family)
MAKMKRREFMIKGTSAAVGAGLSLRHGKRIHGQNRRSKVVEVSHSKAVRDKRIVDVKAVKDMLGRGMSRLTGSPNPWEHFLKPTDTVGLKINTLGRPLLYTHHELIQAVVDELLAFGVMENRIIIWDRYESHMLNANFTMNNSGVGVQCYGTVSADRKTIRTDPQVQYKSSFDDPEKRENDGMVSPFSKIFTRECDKIINMAILKDHGNSGVTLCLKNIAYGVCENNPRFHGPEHIGPFISDLCALPLVKEKVVLHMIDGLEGCFDQGPVPSNPRVIYAPQKLWLGTDPVAMDAVGFEVIDSKRKEGGLSPLSQSGRPIDHIQLAAGKGVGISDLSRIQIDRVNLR